MSEDDENMDMDGQKIEEGKFQFITDYIHPSQLENRQGGGDQLGLEIPDVSREEEEELLYQNLSGQQINQDFENFPQVSANNTMHVQQEQPGIVEEEEQQI
jgi:hypothetical protein